VDFTNTIQRFAPVSVLCKFSESEIKWNNVRVLDLYVTWVWVEGVMVVAVTFVLMLMPLGQGLAAVFFGAENRIFQVD